MMYIRKGKSGELVAQVDNRLAGMMLGDIPGNWEEKKFTDGSKKNCFVFTAFCAYGNDMIKVYVHEGDYMSNEL